MGSQGQRRLRRPRDKEETVRTLVDSGPFDAYRDVLVFAAALGFHEGRRAAFEQDSEPIRWDAATNRTGTEELSRMLAAEETDDAEVLREDRFDERLTIFEEYANGGLEFLAELLQARPGSPHNVILELVWKALGAEPDADADAEGEGAELSGSDLIV